MKKATSKSKKKLTAKKICSGGVTVTCNGLEPIGYSIEIEDFYGVGFKAGKSDTIKRIQEWVEKEENRRYIQRFDVRKNKTLEEVVVFSEKNLKQFLKTL